MEDFEDKVWQQLLGGKRIWSVTETNGNYDRFQIEVIEPLEYFQSLGRIQINCHECSARGRKLIDQVRIIGELMDD